jgi:glycosyltransferase involved in cell wall biosynthesis
MSRLQRWREAASLTLVLLGLTVAAAHDGKYIGCYSDRADVVQRALPMLQEISQEMTVAKCLNKCASLGFKYTGLEYKHECYCGSVPPKYEKLKDEQCRTPCGGGGEDFCGGALSLSVYEQKVEQPTFDKDRPLVCLVMILKNEAHTVLNTLRTVKDYIDCWQILDTGSTDGTQKAIRTYFNENASKLPSLRGQTVPGEIYEEMFVDYGVTRNRILILAKEKVNPIFTLMLSADEEVRNPAEVRTFLEQCRYARGTQHGAYPVVMNTGVKFDSVRLARVDAGWRYRGRVHEYLAPPDGPYTSLYRSEIPFDVAFNATDGPRRFQSQFFIRQILEEDLAKDGNDTRSIYYLARTNSGINNHSEAYRYYDMLSRRSKWDEEIYHGMVMKALESKFLDTHWHDRQTMLLDAFNYKPNNMDALHALAQDHFDSGRFQLAYVFALRAVAVPMPPSLSTIENVLLRPTKYLYDYEGHRLLGFAAREIGEWSQCVESFNRVLSFQKDDTIVQDRVKLCQEKLLASGQYVQPAIHPEPENAAVAEDLELGLEKDPRKQKLVFGGRRKRKGDNAEAFVDDTSDLSNSLQHHDSRFDAKTGMMHVDVQVNYIIMVLVVLLGIVAVWLLRKVCGPEEKVKSRD